MRIVPPFSGKNVRNDIGLSSAGFAHSMRSFEYKGSFKKENK